MRWVRVAITAAIGVVALLAWSPSAQAAFGLTEGLSGHAKLRFKLKLRDTAGKRTKLTVRAK